MHITEDHTWLISWGEISIELLLSDKSTGVAAESPMLLERRFVQDFIAVIVVRGLGNSFEHLIWS
jgi:hypothetical protein